MQLHAAVPQTRVHRAGLLCRKYDIAVIRENDYIVRIDRIKCLKEILNGRIHALTTFDTDIRSEFEEGSVDPFARRNGDDTVSGAGLKGLGSVTIRHGLITGLPFLRMLERHVLDLKGEEFAVLLTVLEHRTRILGMNMRFYDGTVPEENDRIALSFEVLPEFLGVKSVDIRLGAGKTE